PGEQRRNEGVLFDTTRNSLIGVERDAKQQAFLDQLKYNAVQRNPWIDALSSGMSAYAGGGF
ncbi:MAG: hypothetical protein ACTS5I_11245, partial [Rhodanobacter sp.]